MLVKYDLERTKTDRTRQMTFLHVTSRFVSSFVLFLTIMMMMSGICNNNNYVVFVNEEIHSYQFHATALKSITLSFKENRTEWMHLIYALEPDHSIGNNGTQRSYLITFLVTHARCI